MDVDPNREFSLYMLSPPFSLSSALQLHWTPTTQPPLYGSNILLFLQHKENGVVMQPPSNREQYFKFLIL